MAGEKSKELVAQEQAALALFTEAGTESGFEGTNGDTFKTPFIKILQALSPEVDESDANYVPGAKVGMFLNTATKLLSTELTGVVLKMEHTLMVWKPLRGGLVGIYSKAEEAKIVADRKGPKKWDADGNTIDDTLSFYMMNPEDPMDIYILSVSSASFKHGKSFATRLRSLKMNGQHVKKTWAGIWAIGIVQEKNDQGKWYSIGSTPEFKEFVTADLVNMAIVPALELLKTAETDFNEMKDSGHSGTVDGDSHSTEAF